MIRIWILLLLCVMGGCRLVREEEVFVRDARAGELVVMSFNLRVASPRDGVNSWGNRREFVADVIQSASPDVLGTQEGLIAQVRFLEGRLWEYQRFGVGRDDGKEGGEFAAIFLKKSRFDVIESGTFWLSQTPAVPSKGWDARYPRVVTWVRAIDRVAGRRLLLVNTHWDNWGKKARTESALMIHAWLAEHGKGDAVVMTGDLNSREDTEQYRVLVNESATVRLFDSYRELHPQRASDESTSSKFWGRTKGWRIDYILHTDQLEPTEAVIGRVSREWRYPSDHHPIVAFFRWR